MLTVEADFSALIQHWAGRVEATLEDFIKEFIQDLNEEIVRGTPVRTGFLRGSWQASIGSPPAGIGGGVPDTAGAATIARLNLVAAQLDIGDVYYMVNGASYAIHVELGTSRMAPRRFVSSVVDRADRIAEATARRLGLRS